MNKTIDTIAAQYDEIDRLNGINGELLGALRHIRKLVSPYLIGAEECGKLDAVMLKAGVQP